MTRTIDGRKYLMRDARPVRELRKFHRAYEAKYGQIDFHKWMAERGKVSVTIRKPK